MTGLPTANDLPHPGSRGKNCGLSVHHKGIHLGGYSLTFERPVFRNNRQDWRERSLNSKLDQKGTSGATQQKKQVGGTPKTELTQIDAAGSASVTTERSTADLLIAFGTTTGTAPSVIHEGDFSELPDQQLVTGWIKMQWLSSWFPQLVKGSSQMIQRNFGVSSVENPFLLYQFASPPLDLVTYEMYNYPAKKLHNRLKQLSGISPFEVCLCDDQHDCGYAGALNPYLERCWRAWVPENCTTNPDSVPVERYIY
ncbi:unnamed protein product [Orchesella dallaii]|uniref:Uncharacterized protein n=1 Tax=Orchesella dallaii TaxID=48710 RepID=A0ABP1PYF6_9HEXA